MTVYSLGPVYRPLIFFSTAFFGLGVVLTIVHLVTASEPPPVRAFMVLWIAGIAYAQYWYLFRQAYELRFDSEFLYWKSPLRSGKVLLSDLKRVRVRWGTDALVDSVDGRLHIFAEKGFGRFCGELATRCPGVRFRIGMMSRILEWLPGTSRFRS